MSSCSFVLPSLPLLLDVVDVQCASIISQEKVSNFYNFPGKDQRFLKLPKRWTPFWQPTSKGNLRSRAVKKSAEWKCQHKKPTQHPTLLFWISYDDSETTNIWIQHTQKKTHSSSPKNDSAVIESNTPPNVWKDHNHLSTKKPLSATAPLIKNRSWCIKSRLGSQRTLTWCKRYWSVSYASDHNIFLCSMPIIYEETLIHFGSDISKIVAMLIFGNVSYFC